LPHQGLALGTMNESWSVPLRREGIEHTQKDSEGRIRRLGPEAQRKAQKF
jgi:hypothetical protein